MEQRPFGSTGREVAIIAGHWYLEHGDAETAIAALRRGLDLGMTHIDSAEMYGSGAAESLVGEAIAGRRDEVFLVSKVLPSNASRNGRSPLRTVAQAARTDRLDCYLLHWRGSHPLADTVAAFERLRADGKIVSWASAISTWTISMKSARSLAPTSSFAIRCSTICGSARSSMALSLGAKRTASPSSPIARSVMLADFLSPYRGRSGADGDRRPAQFHAAPGGAAFSHSATVAVCHPKASNRSMRKRTRGRRARS